MSTVYHVQAPDGSTLHIEGPDNASDSDIQAAAAAAFNAPTDAPAGPMPSDQYRAHLHQMLADPKTSNDDIRQFVTAQHRTAAPGSSLDPALNWRSQHMDRGGDIGITDNGPESPNVVHAPDSTLYSGAQSLAEGFTAGALHPVGAALDAVLPWVGKIDDPNMKSMWDGASFSDAYHNNLSILKAEDQADSAAHPGVTATGQLAGAVLSPINKIAAPVEGASIASNLLRVGASGATYGAVQGASGSNASNLLGVAKDAAVKSGEYGAGSMLLGGIVSAPAIVRSARAANRVTDPLMSAFDRQGVPALPADVAGTGTKMATSAAKMTLGGIPIHDAAQASVNAAGAARDRVAELIGNVADSARVAGQAVQRGAKAFMATTKSTAERLYEAIPITADHSAVLANTRQKLADLTTGLKSNPELSAIIADPKMQRIADAITGTAANVDTGVLDAAGNPVTRAVQKGGTLSWRDLNAFRSYIGEKAGAQALQSDTSQAALKSLYGALSEDMRATAANAGPDALAAFTRANNYYRARANRIESIVTPILGKNMDATDESAFKAIQSWAGDRGSFAKTAQALRTLPTEEANTVRATIFNALGKSPPGAQNAAGDAFSPATFQTQWAKIPEDTRAVLFPGKQYQQDISDLVAITGAQKAAGKYNNTSNTGLVIDIANAAGHVLRLFSDPLTTIGSLGGQVAAGKLLASPGFARWLASAPAKVTPAAQLAHVNRLTQLAAREPAIASNVVYLQQRLSDALAHSPQPLAAEDQKRH